MFFIILISNFLLGSAYEQETAAFFDAGPENRNIRGVSNMRESFSNPKPREHWGNGETRQICEEQSKTILFSHKNCFRDFHNVPIMCQLHHMDSCKPHFQDLKLTYNSTYIDKADNLLRVPNKYYEEPKTKKKIKKSPKRTVQKIIKKNKFKSRKLYLYPASLEPTMATKSDKVENNPYTGDTSTTEGNFRKKARKNSKYVRYPMPFQNLHRKDGHNRYRREDRGAYILKDLDEIEFLSKEEDHSKVVAHIQNYW